jgi:hypothetical protein
MSYIIGVILCNHACLNAQCNTNPVPSFMTQTKLNVLCLYSYSERFWVESRRNFPRVRFFLFFSGHIFAMRCYRSYFNLESSLFEYESDYRIIRSFRGLIQSSQSNYGKTSSHELEPTL